jgi:two-component system CheB/CheR fusion protein
MSVDANRVYVIPPNAYLSIRERTLRLSAPTAPRSLRMAVDFFLRSLAADQHENAIGVILSGTGTDGTLGLKEINPDHVQALDQIEYINEMQSVGRNYAAKFVNMKPFQRFVG